MMLQQETPDDYVCATGETHMVREFVELAFKVVDIDITWEGSGIDEVGKDSQGNILVRVDPQYFRPTEVELLIGDPTKAKKQLGWVPKTKLSQLVKEMVDSDIAELEK